MTPPCCKKCKKYDDRKSCHDFKKCVRWRSWFSRAWGGIREAVKQIKQEEEPKE